MNNGFKMKPRVIFSLPSPPPSFLPFFHLKADIFPVWLFFTFFFFFCYTHVVIASNSSVLLSNKNQAHGCQPTKWIDGNALVLCTFVCATPDMSLLEHDQRGFPSKGVPDRTRVYTSNQTMRIAPVHEFSPVSCDWHAQWQKRPSYIWAIQKV